MNLNVSTQSLAATRLNQINLVPDNLSLALNDPFGGGRAGELARPVPTAPDMPPSDDELLKACDEALSACAKSIESKNAIIETQNQLLQAQDKQIDQLVEDSRSIMKSPLLWFLVGVAATSATIIILKK